MRRIAVWAMAAAVLLLVAGVPARGQDPGDQGPSGPGGGLEGERLKAGGRWTSQRFEATRVEHRHTLKNIDVGRVTGEIDGLGSAPRTLLVGPVVVQWTDATRLVDIAAGELVPGTAIEAKGQLVAPGHLVADTIQMVIPGAAEIQGMVTAEERRPDGSIVLTVLGIEVRVPAGIPTQSASLVKRFDEKRPDPAHTVSFIGRPLELDGYARTRGQYTRNYDLDNTNRNDQFGLNNRMNLQAMYYITPHVLAFVSGRLNYSASWALDPGTRTDVKELVRREHWLFVGDIADGLLGPGYSLQIGRQKIHEERRWWWRRNLDAARFYFDRPTVHVELAVAQELAPDGTLQHFVDPAQDSVLRNLANVAWAWKEKQRLDFFALYHYDHSGQRLVGDVIRADHEDPEDGRLLWLGTRGSGQIDLGDLGDAFYGLDTAWMQGTEELFDYKSIDPVHERLVAATSHHVRGFAVDARGTWATTLPTRPSLTLGYAFGSGNNDAKRGMDTGFRQTGIDRDRAPFVQGIAPVRYYGELLRPELSNLHIATASVSWPLFQASSVELLYHFYCQDKAAPFLRSAKIADPTGASGLIGHEWDLVLTLEEWVHFEVQLIPALFLAGPAYGSSSGNLAESVLLRLKYKF